MKEKKLSRRERERRRHRQEILDTALRLFSEKGYHNVSMHEIARSAEFGIGTLYKFFKNKEDLYKGLVLEQAEKFHQRLSQVIEEPVEEMQKIRNYIKAKGEVFTANVRMIRLYFAETRGASFNIMAGLDSEVRERYEEFLQRLAKVFESGMKKKQFRKIADPYYLAVALDSLTNAFLFLWLEDPERHPYQKNEGTILTIFLSGLTLSDGASRVD